MKTICWITDSSPNTLIPDQLRFLWYHTSMQLIELKADLFQGFNQVTLKSGQ